MSRIDVLGVEDHVGAERLSDLEFVIVQVDSDDFGCARQAYGLHDQQADHAAAHHDRRVTQFDWRAIGRMDCNRNCFDQGSMLKRQFGGQVIGNVLWHDHVFGKGTVTTKLVAGNAQHLAVLTQVDPSAAAGRTMSARNCRIESDAIADLEVRNVRAHGCDNTGCLVSHH